eukprot:440105_1
MAHALFWTITFHLVTTYSFQSTPTPTSQPPTLLWSLSLGYIKVNLHSETSIATKLDFCRDMFGTSLASIHNATQQADISSEWFGCNPTHSGGDHCKIGLHDLDNDGIYTWFDGTSFNYNAWLSGEPSPSGGCVNTHGNGEWDALPSIGCIGTRQFICNSRPWIYQWSTNNNFIWVGPNRLSWSEAETYCEDTFRASVHSESQNDEVSELCALFGDNNCWIGGNDINEEGVYVWSDGSTFNNPNFTTLTTDNLGNEDCVMMLDDGHWNDAKCDAHSHNYGLGATFVCNSCMSRGEFAYKEGIDETTVETFGSESQSVEWIKVLSCTESKGSSAFTYHYTQCEIHQLSQEAESIKIVPVGSKSNPNYDEYAVIAKPNSNTVLSALNNQYEVSYTVDGTNGANIGYANLSNWIGTNHGKARLVNTCWEASNMSRSFTDYIYHAGCNQKGIHIYPQTDVCVWEYDAIVGEDIEIYFGYLEPPKYDDWIQPWSTLLPRSCNRMAAGYDSITDTIWLLGGEYVRQQLISFKDDSFVDHGVSNLSHNIFGAGQYYKQIDNMLWIIIKMNMIC